MERRGFYPKPPKKGKYESIIEMYREVLTDDEMGVFLALHEEGSVERAAQGLGMTIEEVTEVVERYIPKKQESRSMRADGEPHRRRLSQEAFKAILASHDDLNDREREIIQSLVGAQNQVVAASSLGLTYSAFMKEYIAIRKKHGF